MKFAVLALLGLVTVDAIKLGHKNQASVNPEHAKGIFEHCDTNNNDRLSFQEGANCIAEMILKHDPSKPREAVMDYARQHLESQWPDHVDREEGLTFQQLLEMIKNGERQAKKDAERRHKEKEERREEKGPNPKQLFEFCDADKNSLLTFREGVQCYVNYTISKDPEAAKHKEAIEKHAEEKIKEFWPEGRDPEKGLTYEEFVAAMTNQQKKDHEQKKDDGEHPQHWSPQKIFREGDKNQDGVLTIPELVQAYVDLIFRYNPDAHPEGVQNYAKERMYRLAKELFGNEVKELSFEMFQKLFHRLAEEDRAKEQKKDDNEDESIAKAFESCNFDKDQKLSFEEGVKCYAGMLVHGEGFDQQEAEQYATSVISRFWPQDHSVGLTIEEFRQFYHSVKAHHESKFNDSDSKEENQGDNGGKPDQADQIFDSCDRSGNGLLSFKEIHTCAVELYVKGGKPREDAEKEAYRTIDGVWPQGVDRDDGLTREQWRAAYNRARNQHDQKEGDNEDAEQIEIYKAFQYCDANGDEKLHQDELIKCGQDWIAYLIKKNWPEGREAISREEFTHFARAVGVGRQ